MDGPTHTAKWLEDRTYALMRADPANDAGEIALLLQVVSLFLTRFGDSLLLDTYATEKLHSGRGNLLMAVGAEIGGRSREDYLSFAASDFDTLAGLEFKKA